MNLLLLSEKSEFQRAGEIIANSKHNTQLIGYLNQIGENGALGSFSEIKKLELKPLINQYYYL